MKIKELKKRDKVSHDILGKGEIVSVNPHYVRIKQAYSILKISFACASAPLSDLKLRLEANHDN